MSTIEAWSVMATRNVLASGRMNSSPRTWLKPRHERLQLSQHVFSPHRALVSAPTANEEESPSISRSRPALAHGGLTQETA